MTDKELQDLIRLKKYEQPEEGYFNDFLVEFQERQRAEMLKTSARGLLVERAKASFSEFGALRWVMGIGTAYAALALVLHFIPNQEKGEFTLALNENEKNEVKLEKKQVSADSLELEYAGQEAEFSMVFTEPVDFSVPAPAFSADERYF
jgi:hypothetical protein